MTPPYAAVILAGGAARRMGGRAKPDLLVGGRRLLDRVLDAVADARTTIVVGPALAVPTGVRVVQERPPGGGPVAALAAALPYVDVDRVVLLAADLPFLTAPVVAALLAAAATCDGALLTDAEGRDQLLVGAWSRGALTGALAALPWVEGAALRGVLGRLDVTRLTWEVPPGTPPPWWDCDQAADLDRAQRWSTDGGPR